MTTADGATAPETTPAQATRPGRPGWLIWVVLVGLVIVFDVVAAFLVPPVAKDPGGACEFPRCGVEALLEPIAPHTVATLVPGSTTFTISATILTTWIVMAIVLVGLLLATRGLTMQPNRVQNFVEWVTESMGGFAASFGGPEARRYVPLFLGLFAFIIVSNWVGLIPLAGRLEFLRAPTSDVNVTFGLALVSFVTFHYEGIRALGLRTYLGKFFNVSGFKRGAFDGFVDLFVGLLEFFLEFFKPLTLALRLFANVYGGELVLGVMTALFIALAPIAFLGLELFVGFMQALVFATLTVVFTLIAIEAPHGAESHAEGAHPSSASH
ncbi:MAG TPA: F0F1 ATP synthase subunit A [Candidatus Limnocylindrales bacterium]|nr:F0F1 ATP synthase subunit A [Candidatus Limnocylindrales bacterium]